MKGQGTHEHWLPRGLQVNLSPQTRCAFILCSPKVTHIVRIYGITPDALPVLSASPLGHHRRALAEFF